MPFSFLSIFWPVFKAVLVIFMVAFVSGVLVRKKVISQKDIESLSHVTVYVLLPSLSFSKIIQYFHPDEFTLWWILPLIALGMIATGMLFSGLLFFNELKTKKGYIAVSSLMNANYMVLPIGLMVFKDQFDLFAAYCFLFILAVNPSLWSIGKYLVTSGPESKFSYKSLITPPLIASLLAITLVLLRLTRFVPELILQPIDFIGQAAIPLATFILGATLGSISFRKIPPFKDIIKVVATKLFLLPVVVIFFLYHSGFAVNFPLIADLLVIQASVAPATQLIIQVRKYGGNVQEIGSMMLINYALCILTIPGWLAFWRFLIS